MGDFNFHFENVENNNSRKLHDIIDMFNLTQSVSEPAHNQGHLLDLVFSKKSDNILISTKLHHGLTSDHLRKSAPSELFFPPPNPTACPDTSFAGNPLLTFEPVTDEFVLKIINSVSAKSCELDPIPTTFLYENLDILLPTITKSSTHLLPLALYHVI